MRATRLLVIRPARLDESRALSALAFASKRHWPYAAAQLEAWRDDLSITPETIAASIVHVAQAGDEVLGVYVLRPSADPTWELDHLWIAPTALRRGIGRALLRHAGAEAMRRGASALSIDADPFAEAFYLACGARRVGTLAAPISGMPERVRPQLRLQL